MQIDNEAEQLSIYDLDLWCGRMCPEPSPAEHQKERISGSSSRRSSELKSVVFQSLDLTPGAGNLLGVFVKRKCEQKGPKKVSTFSTRFHVVSNVFPKYQMLTF